MKNIILNIIFGLTLILAGLSAAQEKLWPEKVDAIILLDENEVKITSMKKIRFKKHRIVKVFNKAGKEYGGTTVNEHKYARCKKIKAKLLDPDGKEIRKLRKNEIQKSAHFPGYILYDDSRYKSFDLGLNTYPYLVEYSYEIELKSLFFWPDWYPQADVPVLKSSYKLILKNGIKYHTHPIGIETEPRISQKGDRTTYLWELTGIKPRIEESYMSPDNKLQQAILFSPKEFIIEEYTGNFQSWTGYAEWYRRLSQGKAVLSQQAKQHAAGLVLPSDSDKQKVQKLYAFLQDYTRYVAIEPGLSGWQPSFAESVYSNRYGDCKDLSIFMISLLNEFKIKAFPALVRTRDIGGLIREFPSPQFNHVITCVPLEQDTLWLECTAKNMIAGELPSSVEGCDLLLVEPKRGRIVRTPVSSFLKNQWNCEIKGKLSSAGGFQFDGRISSTGNYSNRLRGVLNSIKPEDQQRFVKSLLSRYQPKLGLLTCKIEHLEQDFEQPLVFHFTAEIKKYSRRSANRLFINPNLISRQTADDLPREDEREFPIKLRFASESIDSVTIVIPDGYELEATPQMEDLKMPFGYFKTSCLFVDGELRCRRILRYTQDQIPTELYPEFVTFLKRIVKSDKSQFVFRKKRG